MDETHLSDDTIKQFSEWLVDAEENFIYVPKSSKPELGSGSANQTECMTEWYFQGQIPVHLGSSTNFSLNPSRITTIAQNMLCLIPLPRSFQLLVQMHRERLAQRGKEFFPMIRLPMFTSSYISRL